MEKKYMSVPEMAKYLGVSRPFAYELAKIEDFPAIVLGERRIVVVADMLDDWMHRKVQIKVDGKSGKFDFIEGADNDEAMHGAIQEERAGA